MACLPARSRCPVGAAADAVLPFEGTRASQATRKQRQIIYAADFAGMRALIDFIMRDCCQGHPQLCGGMAAPECEGVGKCVREDADV
jgi:hypothetical protein